MMSVEERIVTAVRENSLVFLNKAIRELTSYDDSSDHPLPIDVATISTSLIQIAFELILTSYSIENHGIRSVLQPKDKSKGDEEILSLFTSGNLKTIQFDDLKERIQKSDRIFSEHDIASIGSFQAMRNRLVHLHYDLSAGDRYDLKYEIIYYIVHVIVPLLPASEHDWSESIAVENRLEPETFRKLVSFPPYVQRMQTLARRASANVYTCFYCGNQTFAQGVLLCYACNCQFELEQFADCGKCKAKRAVIFDHLNISLNNNQARGLCMNCNEDDIVYKCPKCDEAYCMEGLIGKETCSPEHCIYN
jgi:hypothetical protein